MTGMEPITARGRSATTIVFDGAMLHIHRIGKATKQIPLDHITAVQFKAAKPIIDGFIQFTLAGGDETSVVFRHGLMPPFEEIRGRIQGALTARQIGGGQPAAPDVQARMQQLRAMLDDGLITTGEYDLKRIELLSEL